MNVLVVFYSRTGHTAQVAEALSRCLGCECEKISDAEKRSGPLGFIRSGREAKKRELPPITIEKDPSRYDLVVIGTPVWVKTMASPVRTFLSQHKDDFKKVAFFCTCGGVGADDTFAEMEHLCQKRPVGVLRVTTSEVWSGEYRGQVEAFARALQGG